jgi:hypothetical protein
MSTSKLYEKQQQNIFNKMKKALPKWEEMIDSSFMSTTFKEAYKLIMKERMQRLQ